MDFLPVKEVQKQQLEVLSIGSPEFESEKRAGAK